MTAPLTPLLAPLLAHQGGWDEIALLVGPLVVVAVLIFGSRRRDEDEGETDDQLGEQSGDQSGDQSGADDR
jgi:hypothetical protein